MNVNDIVVLENNTRYSLLEETSKEGITYFLAAEVDEEENVNTQNLTLFKLDSCDDGDYVELINDKNLINELSKKIKDASK